MFALGAANLIMRIPVRVLLFLAAAQCIEPPKWLILVSLGILSATADELRDTCPPAVLLPGLYLEILSG